ncbi:MAG: TIGR00268 family protein, partial [Firmicutes bacterium]|nr:TIGR00268 family protein [Bacillota bacterium]
MNQTITEKYTYLQDYLKSLGSKAVAFSGGVDSTFLLRVAHDVLGDNVLAVTAASCSFPERELREAKK